MINEIKVAELTATYSNTNKRDGFLMPAFDNNSQKGIRLLVQTVASEPFVISLKQNKWTCGEIHLTE
jgi:hypothetical protein